MQFAFYMDVHVPAAVTSGLRRRGVDVLTAQEDGRSTVDDDGLLQRATELERVLVTQDDDFLALATEWQQSGRHFSGIIFAHQLGPQIGVMVEDLDLLAQAGEVDELHARVTFLPLQ